MGTGKGGFIKGSKKDGWDQWDEWDGDDGCGRGKDFRFHHKGGLALYRRPSSASLVAACHFDIHGAIMAHPGTTIKP